MIHRNLYPIPKPRPYVFILWGAQCEEAPTAIFVTELRAAGLPVKVVGLSGLHAGGVHRLVLTLDITLGQALPLATQARCVIVPCAPATLYRLAGDPRLSEFLALCQAQGALFVVGNVEPSLLQDIGIDTSSKQASNILIFPSGPALFDFAQDLIHQLTHPDEPNVQHAYMDHE